MAEFTLRTRAWLPSVVLVALLVESGVSVSNARAAISRLARRGVLETEKHGRNTFYRLSESSTASLVLAGRHLAGHPRLAEMWDGDWSLVVFSLPHEQSAERRALRSQLRWQGFAPLYDGLWVHPTPLSADGVERMTSIAPGRITVFRAEHQSFSLPTGRTPLDAWDLAGLSTRYHGFIEHWQARLAQPGFGRLAGPEAFRTRADVLEHYRLLPLLDPPLPLSDMPPDWPRVRAHETFTSAYDGLAQPALRHVLDMIAQLSGAGSAGIGTHTVAEMAAGVSIAEPAATD
jgi:phenylacetic acid degradation operon negative regulatory protein